MFQFRLFSALFLSFFIMSSQAAVPAPWIATDQAENITFNLYTCVDAAKKSLAKHGFQRISVQGTSIFAAYNSGVNYHYKAIIKCLDIYHLVTITIAANKKGGLKLARALTKTMRNHAEDKPVIIDEKADPKSSFPDCTDGPTLLRCLNTIDTEDLDIAQDYLKKRQSPLKK
jgi:hypothetical protein